MLDDFVTQAREYALRRGITLTTLGLYSVADSRLFSRLEAGGQCLPRTMERVRAYMAAHPVDAAPVNTNKESSHDITKNNRASDAA